MYTVKLQSCLGNFHKMFMGRGGQAPRISAIDNGYFPAARQDMINEVEKI